MYAHVRPRLGLNRRVRLIRDRRVRRHVDSSRVVVVFDAPIRHRPSRSKAIRRRENNRRPCPNNSAPRLWRYVSRDTALDKRGLYFSGPGAVRARTDVKHTVSALQHVAAVIKQHDASLGYADTCVCARVPVRACVRACTGCSGPIRFLFVDLSTNPRCISQRLKRRVEFIIFRLQAIKNEKVLFLSFSFSLFLSRNRSQRCKNSRIS